MTVYCLCFFSSSSFFFFLLGGKGGNASCTVTPCSAVCGTPTGLASGPTVEMAIMNQVIMNQFDSESILALTELGDTKKTVCDVEYMW